MTEETENINNAPRTTDAGIDNGAALDPRATTSNENLNDMNARIIELQKLKDDTVEELRSITAERQSVAAGAVWSSKIEDMNPAEIIALEEALKNRKANSQQLGVNGIESREGVNGQIQDIDTE